MSDVAKAAGVSRTTVSFVWNNTPHSNIPEATRRRVLQVVQELNYIPNIPATNLAKGKTMLIALVVRQTSEQMSADLYAGEFIRGLTSTIEAADYHLVIHAAEPNTEISTYGQLIRTRKVDGLLIASPLVNDPEVKLLHDEGTPIVLNGASDNPDIPSVDVNNAESAYTAVRYLLDLGHRRIGHISNAPFSYRSSWERLNGYRQALEDAGIAYDPALVREGAFTDASGCAPMLALLDLRERPTAVFIGSDAVAFGALEAIHSRGLRIPEDISIISFDDIPIIKYLRPPLTSIHLPAYDIGKRAGEMLLKILNGEQLESSRVSLPTELVIRGSTARLLS
jgi:LacI family transcriptional regulator